MTEAAVTTQIADYLISKGTGTGGDATIPLLNIVFPYPPTFTPEGDILTSEYPGQATGVICYVYLEESTDTQIEFRGKTDPGGKKCVYKLHLICPLLSEKPLSQDVGADAVTFKDGLRAAIRASKNCGGTGPIFQWGQGDFVGGADILIASMLPRTFKGGGRKIVRMTATLTVIELIDP
jgi:hypothetical protein